MNSPESRSIGQQIAYFPALTGIRALAAFLVYAHHVRPPEGKLPEILQNYLTAGYIGVSIFFVLSGFLISYRYATWLQSSEKRFSAYMIRRIARILPLYIVLTIIILIWQKDHSIAHWLLNLSLLKGFFDNEKFSGIAQGWSITVEETFYLAAPFLFIGFRKFKIGAVFFILLTGIGLVGIAQASGSDSFMQNLDFMAEFTLFGRIFEFYCGYLLAMYLKKNSATNNPGSFFTIAGSLLTFAGFSLVAFSHDLHVNTPVAPEILANNFFLPPGIALWFYGLITEKTWLRNVFSTKLFQVLGRSSYAFYLIHAGLFFELIYFQITTNKILAFLLLNICAIAIYYLFEEPVNQFIRRKFDARALRKSIKEQPDFLKQKA